MATVYDGRMTGDDEPELFAIAYSTAYLALAALITLREDVDYEYGDATREYVTRVLELIKRQPETVLTLTSADLEHVGPHLLDNSPAWLDD
jgi:hypothetical protein